MGAIEKKAGAPASAGLVVSGEAGFALEVAAAGGHHVLISGAPDTGRTVFAGLLAGLLPVPAEDGRSGAPLVVPQHSASIPALIGSAARPGAVSEAHGGVLFLDEPTRFGPRVLESLLPALDHGEVRILGRAGATCWPARFQLMVAMSPCSCSMTGSEGCSCSAQDRRRHTAGLSSLLLDRMDVRVRLPERSGERGVAEPFEAVRARVMSARAVARERWRDYGWETNADVPGSALRGEFKPPEAAFALVELALRRGMLTVRGADRCLRVAWTLADLAGKGRPSVAETAQALALRDRRISEEAGW